MTARARAIHLWASTAVLLAAAFELLRHADDLSFWFDELWSVFQDTRPLEQVVGGRELNWPPGYAVLLHGWMRLISPHDFAVHLLGVLIGLLAVAFMIRAGRVLHSSPAGWLAGLAFGTSSYALYFLLEARGYGLLMLLAAALVAFHARWTRRRTWARAVPYALAQILLLYTHFSALVIVALSGLSVVLRVPRRDWPRWLAILAITGLACLPIAPQFVESYRLRANAMRHGVAENLLGGPAILTRAYSAHHEAWLAALGVLAAVGLILWLRRGRSAWGAVLWLAAWGFGFPLYAYLTRAETGLFSTRYLSLSIPAVLLLAGIGLAQLPRPGAWAGAALLVGLASFPWQPFDHRPQYSDSPPVRDLVRELARRFQPGDVLVIDPHVGYGDYAWWYYEPLYFPGGRIPQAASGDGAGPRVWYLVRQGSEDAAVRASVERGRIATEFWGPWYYIATLYQGPPLTPGVRLGDAIRFRGAELPGGTRYLLGDSLVVRTWWSVDARPPLDYSIGLRLVDAQGNLAAQSDSGPQGAYTPGQTSAWEPGQVYRDDRALALPDCLAPGDYEVRLVVYQSWDGQRLAPEAGPPRGADDELVLGTVKLDSFSYCWRRDSR